MTTSATVLDAQRVLHAAALYALGAAAAAMAAWTLLAAAGVLPWLTLAAGIGEAAQPGAGPAAQVAVTVLLALVLAVMPSGSRVLALEAGHRDFRIGMRDVAHAYHLAHRADRAGVFAVSSEFDEVRDRLAHLRAHPDLKLLEADVLTVAAQMSQRAHELAVTYSDERVARARAFLAQRQEEAEDHQRRIDEALRACHEIRRWADRVELDEAFVASRLHQLEEELREVLPRLGFDADALRPRPPADAAPAPLKFAAE